MSHDCKTYDSNEVVMSIAGIPIDSGYAAGEFIRIEQTSDDFEIVVGTDGEVSRSKTNDATATITVILMSTSDGNARLSALNNLDKAKKNGAGIGPLLIRDTQGTSVYAASKCWVAKPPTVSFDKTATPREWKLMCADLVRLDGGN